MPKSADQHYRSLFSEMLNGLAYCKVLTDSPAPHDFVYLEVNRAFEAQTGLTNVAGKKVSEVIPGIREQDPWLLNLYSEVAATGRPQKFERYVEALEAWFSVSVYCPDRGYFVAVFDVTTRQREAEALRETKERLSLVIDSSSDGYTDWEIPSGRVKYSKRFANMLGYDLAELEPSVATWERLVHPDDKQRAWDSAQPHLRGETDQYECEERLRHKDGRWLWTLLRAKIVTRDSGGAPVRFAGTHTDITDRKFAEEALREAEERSRSILTAMAEGVVMQDASGRIVQCNGAAERILGLSREQMEGRSSVDPRWRSVHEDGSPFPGEDHPAMVTLRTGKPVKNVMMGVHKPDGALTWISVNAEPVRESGGGPPRSVVTTFSDVTEIKRAEEARREVEERSRSIERFAAEETLERKRELEAILKSAMDGIYILDVNGRVMEVNDAACASHGLAREEMLGKSLREIGVLEDSEYTRAHIQKILSTGGDRFDSSHRAKDGGIFVTDVSARVVSDGSGRVVAFVRDITDRKRIEERLKTTTGEAERRARELQAVLDAVPAAVFITRDPSAQHMETNRFGAELMRVPPDANVSKSAPEGQRPRTFKAMKNGLELSPRHLPVQVAAAQGVEVRGFEFDLVTEGGFTRNLVGNASPLRDESGKPAGAVGAFIDVTAIREAEARVRESEERLRAIFRSPGVGIAITSQAVGFMEVNDKFCSMLGYSREELQGRPWLELTHPDDVSADAADTRRLAAGEIQSFSRDKRYLRKDGSVLWALVSASCVRATSGVIKYGVAVVKDISKRKEAEKLLQESQNRLAAAIEGSRDGYIHLDLPTGRSHRSPRYWEIIGWPPGSYSDSPMDFLRLIHTDDSERVMESYRSITTGRTGASDEEFRIRSSAGTWTWANTRVRVVARDADGKPCQIAGTITDVTERRDIQERVAVTQRLASLGTLVAGLAHEINNPLAAEMSGQGLALEVARESRKRVVEGFTVEPDRRLRELGDVIEALEDAQEAGQRVAKIVRDMAAFARPDATRTRVRLQEVVDEAIRWVPKPLATTADIEVEDHGPPDVLASAGQMAQVVLNLLTNALKATAPGKRGRVVIRFGTGNAGRAFLEIGDNGVGIASEHRSRVFEPFFTTRPSGEGRGTGLGLAVCHSIVTAHGGTISVKSEVGKGSTFRVELPVAPVEA